MDNEDNKEMKESILLKIAFIILCVSLIPSFFHSDLLGSICLVMVLLDIIAMGVDLIAVDNYNNNTQKANIKERKKEKL